MIVAIDITCIYIFKLFLTYSLLMIYEIPVPLLGLQAVLESPKPERGVMTAETEVAGVQAQNAVVLILIPIALQFVLFLLSSLCKGSLMYDLLSLMYSELSIIYYVLLNTLFLYIISYSYAWFC